MSAFFYASLSAAVECPLAPALANSALVKVVDGDTVIVDDGQRVRFSAINTPEIAFKNKPGQALGQEAKRLLSSLLSEGTVKLSQGTSKKDKYGRGLFHVFDHQGRSVEEQLIIKGLAFHVAIPPNLTMAECLADAEDQARRQKLGVWSDPFWRPLSADKPLRGGFGLVVGQVEKISKARTATYIDFDGQLTLRIDKADLQYFSKRWWQELPKYRWIAKGWIIDRKNIKPPYKRWMIKLGHPAMLLRSDPI